MSQQNGVKYVITQHAMSATTGQQNVIKPRYTAIAKFCGDKGCSKKVNELKQLQTLNKC